MEIAFIDNLAYNLDSVLHRSSAISKIIFFALTLAAIIYTANVYALTAILIIIIGLMFLADLPVLKVLSFTGYALFFGLIFAVSGVVAAPLTPLVIILKTVTSASAVLLLLTTTHYVDIFAFLSVFLPNIIVDAMFMTYRSFFILLDQFSTLLKDMRMRGSLSFFKLIKNLNSMGRMLGHILVHAFEMGERLQNIMLIRGYKSGLPASSRWRSLTVYDVIPLFVGILILAMVVIL